MTAMTAPSTPDIVFRIEANPEGEVAATVPVSWTLGDELLETMKQDGYYRNPHLLIITATITEREREVWNERSGDYDTVTVTDYDATDVQIVPLVSRRGKPTPHKAFVNFSRAGRNIIIGRVVSPNDRDDWSEIHKWMQPDRLGVTEGIEGTMQLDIDRSYNTTMAVLGRAHIGVEVPRELFSREPRKLSKTIVSQFFRDKGHDACDFRRRLIVSSLLTLPYQLFGLLVRLCSFIVGAFFARRRTFSRTFFALSPFDYWHQLASSWWYMDEDGNERSDIRKWLSPPSIVGVLVATCLIVGVFIAPGLFLAEQAGRGWPFAILSSLVIWLVIGTLLVMREGDIRRALADQIRLLLTEKRIAKRQPTSGVIATLKGAQTTALPSQIDNATVRLKFLALKSQVCKPFAR